MGLSPGSATLPDLPFHSFRALDQEISEFYVLQERHAIGRVTVSLLTDLLSIYSRILALTNLKKKMNLKGRL